MKLHDRSTIKTIYKLARRLICCHIGVGIFGAVMVATGVIYKATDKPEHHVEISSINKDSLRKGIASAIGSSAPPYVLWGESNHCDLRQIEFLSDTTTLKMLADKGIKRIFIELNPHHQSQIDQVAFDKKSALDLSGTIGGVAYDKHVSVLYTCLIRNAAAVGIRVFACDVNNTWRTSIYALNCSAMVIESIPIAVVNEEAARAWAECGLTVLLNDRLNEEDVASFVTTHSPCGSSLIYRGSAHITSDAPHSLRKSLPTTTLFMSFSESSEHTAPQKTTHESERTSFEKLGFPYRPPDIVINLETAAIEKRAP